MKKRNYGFINDRKKTDFVFGGGNVPMDVLQPDGDWMPYLPIKEFQAPYGFETFSCVTYTLLNCLELLIKRQYGEDVNYSDRFLAIVSGTKSPGNSPQAVCEFLRKIGVVPEELWPYDSSINSWEKWSVPIPPKLYELAREFNEKWDFRYEEVPSNHEAISEALKCSPLLISVYAWRERNGRYYKPSGARDNHATSMFYQRIGEFRRVFDSYDRPYLKDVEWDSLPEFIQRYWIKKKSEVAQQISLIQKILNLMYSLLGLLKAESATVPTPTPITPVIAPQPLETPISKYDWDTPILARHSVRVIADEEGLTVEQKDSMCATIGGESEWKIHAKRQNFRKNGTLHSTDWGICQWNDYYHGKEISPDEAMNNPEKAVRLMCAYWKRGQRNLWIAYKNGSYKKYL